MKEYTVSGRSANDPDPVPVMVTQPIALLDFIKKTTKATISLCISSDILGRGRIKLFEMGIRFALFLALFVLACLEVAHLASFLPDHNKGSGIALVQQKTTVTTPSSSTTTAMNQVTYTLSPPSVANQPPGATKTTTAAQFNQTSNLDLQFSTTPTTISTNPPVKTTPATTTTTDPDSEEMIPLTPSTPIQPDLSTSRTPTDGSNANNNKSSNDKINQSSAQNGSVTIELTVFFYSIFLVYVSMTKLIYHNVAIIKHNLTEPGVLMIFGVIWELVTRQISNNYQAFPRFNSRIFFYLFLPSTVLESASILSNKWLFVNMLPILIQSIVGTLLYAASLGFTIYSLSRQNVFEFIPAKPLASNQLMANIENNSFDLETSNNKQLDSQSLLDLNIDLPPPAFVASSDRSIVMELNNLTLADCLVFGTILSSIDSTTMLSIFQTFQVNEKLYYLVVGENLMNNAVVLVLFDLLLDFFSATRLTVVKIYMAIIQFFVTLVGSIFIGLISAGFVLSAVHLTKRFQVTNKLSSYQYQCQAMVETLLILKLAYLTYTLSAFTGTSSILSLATYGILQDQYIKHNLSLRSQLTFKQIILATKTVGFSLVYTLMGMLLVEVANTSQFFQTWNSFNSSQYYSATSSRASLYSAAASKLSHLANQANLGWNFKFLSLVMLFTIIFRFTMVIVLSLFCNLFSSSQLSVKFREQVLVAYGGLKGPLAFALVHKLIEHEEYRDRALKNKHLFIYTILFITFVSTFIKGSLIKFLVIKLTYLYSFKAANQRSLTTGTSTVTMVFDKINDQVLTNLLHSLNSILGHTKTSYEKFVDFNELQLKPWLARKGTNTNWLSIFYDNLILDETLNANCFYRTAEIFATSVPHRPSIISNGILEALQHVRASNNRRRRINPMDTIDENVSLALPTRQRAPQISRRDLNSESLVNEKSLREFVMLDLKMEDAKKRRKDNMKQIQQQSSFNNKPGPSSTKIKTPMVTRMLSSTSSSDMGLTTSSIEVVDFRQSKRDEQDAQGPQQNEPKISDEQSRQQQQNKASTMVTRIPIKKRQPVLRSKMPLEPSKTRHTRKRTTSRMRPIHQEGNIQPSISHIDPRLSSIK